MAMSLLVTVTSKVMVTFERVTVISQDDEQMARANLQTTQMRLFIFTEISLNSAVHWMEKKINVISRNISVKKTPFCKVRLTFDFCFGSKTLSEVNTSSERVTFTNFTCKLSFRISAYHSAQPNSIF